MPGVGKKEASLDQEDLGEVSQLGRRGKASTIRRAVGTFVMPLSTTAGAFQGNFEELGESAGNTSSAIASTSDVEGLAVCEYSLELKRKGATCVAAYVTNLMVKEGLFKEGNNEAVCGSNANGKCALAEQWRKENAIQNIGLSCGNAAKTCRPPMNVAEGERLKVECLGALMSM